MELEVATWLAELIQQALAVMEHRPGLTIEVEDDPSNWVQIIPESDVISEQLTGYSLNFPFRESGDEPEMYVKSAGLRLPPETQFTSWQRGSHITLWIRPDIPLVALALFASDILEKLGKARLGYEVNVQIMHNL